MYWNVHWWLLLSVLGLELMGLERLMGLLEELLEGLARKLWGSLWELTVLVLIILLLWLSKAASEGRLGSVVVCSFLWVRQDGVGLGHLRKHLCSCFTIVGIFVRVVL